jgi:hypothetical protein
VRGIAGGSQSPRGWSQDPPGAGSAALAAVCAEGWAREAKRRAAAGPRRQSGRHPTSRHCRCVPRAQRSALSLTALREGVVVRRSCGSAAGAGARHGGRLRHQAAGSGVRAVDTPRDLACSATAGACLPLCVSGAALVLWFALGTRKGTTRLLVKPRVARPTVSYTVPKRAVGVRSAASSRQLWPLRAVRCIDDRAVCGLVWTAQAEAAILGELAVGTADFGPFNAVGAPCVAARHAWVGCLR